MALFVAGQKVRASQLNAAANNVVMTDDPATTNQTAAAAADIAGCTRTFTTTTAGTQVFVVATWDVSITNDSVNTFVGTLLVDGVAQPAQALLGAPVTAVGKSLRVSISKMYVFTLAAVGSHTVKMRSAVTGGTTTVTNSGNTSMTMVRMAP